MTYAARITLGIVGAWLATILAACAPDAASNQDNQDDLIRVLAVSDPFAHALQRIAPELREQLDMRIEIVDYSSLHTMIQRNHILPQSDFDIISIDVLWLPELAQSGALLSLDQHLGNLVDDPEDFVSVAWQQCQYKDKQWAIPIQPHAELLWVRGDLLDAIGETPPRTTEDVLRLAALLHNPEEGRHGIVWNALRGHPLGQSMAHFYAAHGAQILDDQGRPSLDGPNAIRAAIYAQNLLAYSPPDILQIAWDERVARFALGRTAMAYGWGARSTILAPSSINPFAPKVSYHPAPHATDSTPVTPLGTWSWAIPAQIGPRQQRAMRALTILSSQETHRALISNGMAASPRASLLADSSLQHVHPVFSIMAQLEIDNGLGSDMRPAIPQGPELSLILGTVFHDMLQGSISPEEAVIEAQRQALALWEYTEHQP